MTALSPGQCRVLSYLFFHKPGNVTVTLKAVMTAQDASADEVLDLMVREGLALTSYGGATYVSLGQNGWRLADTPAARVVYQLSEAGRPVVLSSLISVFERVSFDDLAHMQEAGLIEVKSRDGSREIKLTRASDLDRNKGGANDQAVGKLTSRGRQYAAR